MKNFKILLLFTLLLLPGFVIHTYAQVQSEEAENLELMDTGVAYMENEDYASADQYFRTAIDNMKVLPTEICYYFGKNSYFLGKYKQSIDWLNKYIELKGVNGKYFDESVEFLKKSEKAFIAQQDQASPAEQQTAIAEKKSIADKINCKDGQTVVCPVCKGIGVVKKTGALGAEIYSTCIYGESGVLTCEEYKLYVNGDLEPKVKNP